MLMVILSQKHKLHHHVIQGHDVPLDKVRTKNQTCFKHLENYHEVTNMHIVTAVNY